MKAIHASELTIEQWKLYAQMLNEINSRYYPDEKEINWESNKNEVLGHLELLKIDFVNHFLIFDNDQPAAWFAYRILGNDVNFVFDALYDVIPKELMQTIFREIALFLTRINKKIIYGSASDKRIINSMISSGAVITDTLVFSRLMKDEVDEKILKEIVKAMSVNAHYKLVLFNEVTDEIIDRYLDLYNDSRIDMNFYNPEKKIIFKRNKESLLTKLKYDKGPNDKMYMYMLFDGNNIAAFSSLYIREENKNIIDHGGGLTTVNRNYRGQNLARFLKAKLYLKMLEEFPDFEYIKTDTYPWNKYMYRINEEMGFKPFKEYNEFKISKEVLESIIKNNKKQKNEIELKEITKENYIEAIKLKVSTSQDNFVAPNVFSIAQSKFYSGWKPTAIYDDNNMIGFLMYGEDDLNEGDGTIWIIRLMIDERFQGKGYGRESMLKLIDYIKSNCHQKELFVSFVPENLSSKNLYKSLGFFDTGRVEEDEIVFKLNI